MENNTNPSSEEEPSLRDTTNVDLNNVTVVDIDLSPQLPDPFTQIQPVDPLQPDPFIGMEFESEESAKLFYMSYASRVGFSVRISKSRRSRNDESIIMRRFVCSKEGFHLKKSNNNELDEGKKKRKRATIREGCNAMIEVIQKYYGRWIVSKLIKEHNHVIEPPIRVRYIAPEELGHVDPFLGMEFPSHESAQTFYYAYASRVGFDVRIRLSRRSTKDESFVMRRFVCTKEGFALENGEENGEDRNGGKRKKKSRAPTREGCKAMFEVVRKEFDRWVVSKLVLEHTHDLSVLNSKVHYIQSQSEVVVLAKTPQIGDQLANRTPCNDNNSINVNNSKINDNSNDNNMFWNERKRGNNFSFGLDDTQKFLVYLKRMNTENPTFSYAFQVDKNNCLTHAFWADARARASYYYFGDAVTLDTDFKEDSHLLPFITFNGLNHHLQSVLFGCALIVDQNEDSFVWLFENWVASMGTHHPSSLKTAHDDVIGSAISRIFPETRHVFCEKQIFEKCKEKLGHLYSIYPSFEEEFRNAIKGPQTVEEFELGWNLMLEKYDLGENSWIQYLYGIRVKWVPVFLKDTFTGEISLDFEPESLRELYFRKYFNVKTPLQVFITLFDHAMAGWSERESLEDLASSFTKPVLNFPSNLLKQMSGMYTRSVYNIFEKEFVESLGYYVERIEDGLVSKYNVINENNNNIIHKIIYDISDKRASCSCGKFESCGILCRHILRVFLTNGLRTLPDFYVLKRWTKEAKNGFVLDESLRFNELYRDAVRFAKEGSSSGEVFSLAQQNLQVAFSEVYQMKQDMINRCTMR
ncbi:hypothetical protein LUZ60_006212 [Juncus effusus]|nr:hypothetical protein LUZ60_006212 [Juncus effusus]